MNRNYALGALTAVYMLNLVDRGLLALLMQPIKQDLGLSDTQLGFLTGIAFGLFYAVLGLPIARWADRGDRITITSLAIGLWGLTVMACLFVTQYSQLVLARVAAAVGESGCKPPTYSLVGDYFPQPAQRVRAMSIYSAGNYLSSPIAYIVGGWLNERYGWRLTFFLMGIPGLLLALLVKGTVVDPRARSQSQRVAPELHAVFRALWRLRSLRHLSAALILLYTMGLGLSPWYAAFMIRTHGVGTAELGIWLGLILGLGGSIGALLGGQVAGRWFAGDESNQMRMSALTVALTVPCFVAFLSLPSKLEAFVALIPMIVTISMFVGPTYALLQRLVPDEMRATMMALVMLLANLIGFGIGPQAVGVLSDAFGSLRYAMLAVSFIGLWAGWHFWAAARTVREDLACA